MTIANPGGAVTIGGGNTLTIGSAGIDMSSATQDLTVRLANNNAIANSAILNFGHIPSSS